MKIHHLKNLEQFRDFPHGPVVKTLPSNAGDASLIHGQELRCHVPPGQKNKTENRNNIVTNSIKT